jgi:hypothetical protein
MQDRMRSQIAQLLRRMRDRSHDDNRKRGRKRGVEKFAHRSLFNSTRGKQFGCGAESLCPGEPKKM